MKVIVGYINYKEIEVSEEYAFLRENPVWSSLRENTRQEYRKKLNELEQEVAKSLPETAELSSISDGETGELLIEY